MQDRGIRKTLVSVLLCVATLGFVGLASSEDIRRKPNRPAPAEKDPCFEDQELSPDAYRFIEALKDRIEQEALRLPTAPPREGDSP